MPPPVAGTRARLTLAAIQGLVIDHFTTDDPDRVDDTYRRLVDDLVLAPFDPVPARRQRRTPSTANTPTTRRPITSAQCSRHRTQARAIPSSAGSRVRTPTRYCHN